MNEINKTLYIPLYGKSLVSCMGIIQYDPKAEEIWEMEGFPLKGKSASKWLAYYMSMRAVVFDCWVEKKMKENPNAAVLHLGCGLDSFRELSSGYSANSMQATLPGRCTGCMNLKNKKQG